MNGLFWVTKRFALIAGFCVVYSCAPVASATQSDRTIIIDKFLDAEVDGQRLQGGTAVIVDGENVLYERAFGYRDRQHNAHTTRGDLFRLYSMTKPITTVAALILVEDGRLELNAPVGRYLPEFAAPRVYVTRAGADSGANNARMVVPANNPMTILDLLRHTSGLTYGQGGAENERDYRAMGLLPEIWSDRDPMRGRTNAEVSNLLGALPLAFEPGTQWAYGRSTDVLGRVVEVVSGEPLDVFFRRRIFTPLGMRDTDFNVGPADQSRIVEPSVVAAPGEPIAHMIDLSMRQTFLSGGGGLVGSAQDYARFCQMLLNDGALDGVRLLSKRSIDLMFSDQLGPIARSSSFDLGAGYSFGLGGYIRDIQTPAGARQEFGWWGAGGTAFWCDRAAHICGIFLIQQSDEARTFSDRFHDLARQSFR